MMVSLCKQMIRAHMTYVAAVNKGGDGRPDFHARKACNYAEDAIQVFCRWSYHCD